jgi:hypothetical protein
MWLSRVAFTPSTLALSFARLVGQSPWWRSAQAVWWPLCGLIYVVRAYMWTAADAPSALSTRARFPAFSEQPPA